MTSAISSTPNTVDASTTASAPTHSHNSSTSSPLSGAVPTQHPVRSYATATKTATPPTSAGASAPAHNAKPASDASMNGAAAQGGSQPANNSNNGMNGDHSRKPSVVINASGATGQYPNGGPVQNGSSRPAINFGSMNASGAESQPNSGAFHHQSASLQASRGDNPRVTSPAHSPSPIPQPAASGGRPPSMSAQNNGGLAFGSIAADTEMMRGQGPPGNMASLPMHERRTSSNSMHGDQGMARPNFTPGGAGRGRGFPPQQPGFMGSPAQRNQMPYQPSPNMRGPQFQPQPGAPGSPFRQPARASPNPMHAQPHMPQGHPMHYGGYPQHLGPQQHQQAMYGGMPYYDPSQGYHQPFYPYPGYQPTPQSPRPQYPSPYQGPPAGGMQPPFHPPGTPGMARTPSQASERPPSSLGHPQTPAQNAPAPSQTPIQGHQSQPSQGSSNFVRPAKKSSAIKITDAQGNAVDFKKPATPVAQAPPQTPVIVSTPNAPTPPPRAPSNQHNRTESKTTKSSEETKNDFAAQVKRKVEEERKQAEAAKANEAKTGADAEVSKVKEANEAEAKATKERAEKEEAAQQEIKKAAAEAEESAAKAANDKKAEEEAAAAKKGAEESDEARKKREQEEEDERLEREIAEMEAKEREEEERERAYQEKKAKEKAEAAAKEAERAKNTDEELKRQEREAEAREEAREKEREKEREQEEKTSGEPDEESKAMFASLKRPTLGPGASAPAGGTETPASGTSEHAGESDSTSAQPTPRAGAQKPKPAHLKLETNKNVERAEPTPGMQALKSARFLEIKEEAKYPEGFKSPNPALNQSVRKGRAYDKDFLLQFQNVFKEKPSVDWDQKVKDTLGPSDEPGSARGPASARGTPSGMGGRQGSRGGSNFAMGGAMGQFGGPMGAPRAPVPSGTTSEQRFQMSNMGGPPRPGMPMARGPSQLGMGAPGVGMSRQNSMQMGGIGPNSPRNASTRGKGGSKRDDRQQSKRQEQEMANKMPLTAHMDIAPLEKSTGGWKATSIGQPTMAGPAPGGEGNMAPDMVQRKVKAALNKMTPEKFDKIADQILEIAGQSKNESDGRTLRQVIQLTFEKACDEAHWAGMYAKFCHKMLTAMSNEIRDETIKDKNGNPVVGGALFRKYLLNRCQEEFERGWQVNLPEKPEGETQEAALLTDEYYVAAAAKRRGLGLIQFIGQLYKLRMLTLRIMHECVMRLLNFEGDPDEAAVENLTTLLKAVGASMEEEEQGRQLMVTYFKRIEEVLLSNDALPSRPKFMIMDLVDLRKAGWKSKDDAKGPKTIQQIHEEAEAAQAKAEAERQRTQRGGGPGGRPPAGRGDARNFSGGMPPPVDYNRTNVNMDDLRKLQQRGSNRPAGGSLGPGGGLGPSMMGSGRTGSRRGNLAPGSNGTSRTNTPPVEGKKDEPSTAQNAFSALAALDPSGEQPEDAQSQQSEAASPPAARKEPATAEES